MRSQPWRNHTPCLSIPHTGPFHTSHTYPVPLAQTMTGARNPDGTTDPFVMKLTPLNLNPVTAQNTIICVQLQAPCPTIQVGWKGHSQC